MAVPFCVKTDSDVSCVEFGPCHHCTALLAVSTPNTLLIKKCTLKESQLHSVSNLAEALECEDIISVPVYSRIRAMAFSPDSSITSKELFMKLAVADTDRKITVINSDLTGITSQTLESHTKHINDIAFLPTDPNLLVSVGDDCEVKQWDVQNEQVVWSIQLSSAGVSVCLHPEQPLKLMVAEKSGSIHILSLETRLPIITITCPESPLVQADWSASNSLILGAAGGNSWYVWDISESVLPLENGPVHNTVATGFKWCKTSCNVFSTTSLSGQLKIHHLGHHKVPLSTNLPVANQISWHSKLPIAVIASNQLLFWSVER